MFWDITSTHENIYDGECIATIIDGLYQLTIVAKLSILDICKVPGYAPGSICSYLVYTQEGIICLLRSHNFSEN